MGCKEADFCHYASNPGCGGKGASGVATFNNKKRARGCSHAAKLTIPRSYVRDINDLQKKCGQAGTQQMLKEMLISGYNSYGERHVVQCIHQPQTVSVHWLHLHTFC